MNLFSSGLILTDLLDPHPMRAPPRLLIQDFTPAASDPPPEPRSDAPSSPSSSSPENLPDGDDLRRIFESESARDAPIAAAASEIEQKLRFSPSDWRILNVGGTRFESTLQTLTKDNRSMLTAHLNFHPEQEELRFDRDGNRFHHVLNYLRSGTILVDDLPTLREVEEEAEYFQLPGLQELCQERILDLEREKAEERSRRSREITEALIEALFRDSCLKRSPAPEIRSVRRLGDPPLAPAAAPRFDLDADF